MTGRKIEFEGGVVKDERKEGRGGWHVLRADLNLGEHGERNNAVVDKWPESIVNDERIARTAAREANARNILGQKATNFRIETMTTQEAVDAGVIAGIDVVVLPSGR